MIESRERGMLLVVSGPSGVGKGTVCEELMNRNENVVYSISATTRDPRPGEVHGEDYFFISHDEFDHGIEGGRFLEYAHVHGNKYGTPLDFVLDNIGDGKVVILEIDVQGAMDVKETYPDGVFVFILAPSMEELERRLVDRGTESPEQIALRMANAIGEMKLLEEYDYGVVNNVVKEAAAEIEKIIDVENLKIKDNPRYKKYIEEARNA